MFEARSAGALSPTTGENLDLVNLGRCVIHLAIRRSSKRVPLAVSLLARQRVLELFRKHERGTKHSQGCAHAACQSLQKSIDGIACETNSDLTVSKVFTLTHSGRPRRVNRCRASDRGGKATRSTPTNGASRGKTRVTSLAMESSKGTRLGSVPPRRPQGAWRGPELRSIEGRRLGSRKALLFTRGVWETI